MWLTARDLEAAEALRSGAAGAGVLQALAQWELLSAAARAEARGEGSEAGRAAARAAVADLLRRREGAARRALRALTDSELACSSAAAAKAFAATQDSIAATDERIAAFGQRERALTVALKGVPGVQFESAGKVELIQALMKTAARRAAAAGAAQPGGGEGAATSGKVVDNETEKEQLAVTSQRLALEQLRRSLGEADREISALEEEQRAFAQAGCGLQLPLPVRPALRALVNRTVSEVLGHPRYSRPGLNNPAADDARRRCEALAALTDAAVAAFAPALRAAAAREEQQAEPGGADEGEAAARAAKRLRTGDADASASAAAAAPLLPSPLPPDTPVPMFAAAAIARVRLVEALKDLAEASKRVVNVREFLVRQSGMLIVTHLLTCAACYCGLGAGPISLCMLLTCRFVAALLPSPQRARSALKTTALRVICTDLELLASELASRRAEVAPAAAAAAAQRQQQPSRLLRPGTVMAAAVSTAALRLPPPLARAAPALLR